MATTPIVVLLTVNEHEARAVLDTFVGDGKTPETETRGKITYNLLGEHGGMQLVHTISEMGAGSIGASLQRTRQAIDHWKPHAVIAVGIAFGLDEGKQKIGDVLVATQLQGYELGRINKDGTITPRGDKSRASDCLTNRLRQIYQSRPNSMKPTVKFGLMLSGEKLVDNFNYRNSLKKLYTEAIGGEMEGTGLYVSATEHKTDWIVVKAICDWGYKKNNVQKDEWQKIAAKNAAQVVKAAIDKGNIYGSSDGITGTSFNGPCPINNTTLVGRQPQIDTLVNDLIEGKSKALVYLPGVGKTRIAEAIYSNDELHGSFNKILWIDVGKDSDTLSEYEKLAASLDIDEDKTSELKDLDSFKKLLKDTLNKS